jgi:hypothetical protein
MRRMSCRPLVVVALVAGLLLTVSCRSETDGAGDALDTVDVAAPPDVLVDPSQDPVERRREPTLAGVLPSDFPGELPTPRGASLVDLGERSVVFLVPDPPGIVRPRYQSSLRSKGWVEAGENIYRRDDLQVRIELEREGPSTRVTVAY